MSEKCDCLYNDRIEVRYAGNKEADIIYCGESPGDLEEKKGLPFVGRAGQLLEKETAEVGLGWFEILRINASRCRLEKDLLEAAEMRSILACCRENVERILHHVKPKVVVALGDIAFEQIMKKKGSKKNRRRWFWSDEFNCWIMFTYHPAYCLRNPNDTVKMRADLKKVKNFKDAGWKHESEETHYKEVETIQPLIEMIPDLDNPAISFDTETTGLDWLDPNTYVLCYSIGFTTGGAWLIRLYEEAEEGIPIIVKRAPEGKVKRVPKQIYIKECSNFENKVKELFSFLDMPGYKLYMANGNFDRHIMEELFTRQEYPFSPSFQSYKMDIQSAAHVINENNYTLASLQELQEGFTNYSDDYTSSFRQKHDYEDMPGVPVDDMIKYACGDADVTLRAGIKIREILLEKENRKQANYYARLVHPALRVLYDMEKNGSLIDVEALPGVKDQTARRVAELHGAALKVVPPKVLKKHKEAGCSLTRADFKKDVLFSKAGFGLQVKEKTKKTGAPSMTKDARTELLERDLSEAAETFLNTWNEWQELHTLYTRYLKGFEREIKQDRRIHSHFSLATAVTGRVAARSPNMMNNPKRSESAQIVRRLLCASKGSVLLALDAAQAELRWAAHISGDQEMIRVFRDGEDIHTNTALALTGKSRKQMSEKEFAKARRDSKTLNFGTLYLMSPQGFVRYAKKDYGVILTAQEAEEWINTFFSTYPGLRKYHQETIAFCQQHGFVISPLGRRRHLSDINSNNFGVQNAAKRQAVNHPIQSASSDTILLSMAEILDNRLVDPNECRLVNFIHDEVVWECRDKDDIIEKNLKIIQDVMENPPLDRFGIILSVPLTTDAKVGKNLAEMEEV